MQVPELNTHPQAVNDSSTPNHGSPVNFVYMLISSCSLVTSAGEYLRYITHFSSLWPTVINMGVIQQTTTDLIDAMTYCPATAFSWFLGRLWENSHS